MDATDSAGKLCSWAVSWVDVLHASSTALMQAARSSRAHFCCSGFSWQASCRHMQAFENKLACTHMCAHTHALTNAPNFARARAHTHTQAKGGGREREGRGKGRPQQAYQDALCKIRSGRPMHAGRPGTYLGLQLGISCWRQQGTHDGSYLSLHAQHAQHGVRIYKSTCTCRCRGRGNTKQLLVLPCSAG